MIRIYNSIRGINTHKYKVINRNDATFNRNVKPQTLDSTDLELLQRVEWVHNVKSNGACIGRFGPCTIWDISTGMKTLLNIRYILKNRIPNIIVNVTETGPNILECIFNIVDGTDVGLLLEHCDIAECSDHEYLLNERVYVGSTSKLLGILMHKE